MTDALKLCIWEWQLVGLSGVLNYLHNPKRYDLSAVTGSILPILNKIVTQKHAKAVIQWLNSVDNENHEYICKLMPSKSTERQFDILTL